MCECSMQCFVQEVECSGRIYIGFQVEIEGFLIIGLWYRVVHGSEGNANFCHDRIESGTFPSFCNFFSPKSQASVSSFHMLFGWSKRGISETNWGKTW